MEDAEIEVGLRCPSCREPWLRPSIAPRALPLRELPAPLRAALGVPRLRRALDDRAHGEHRDDRAASTAGRRCSSRSEVTAPPMPPIRSPPPSSPPTSGACASRCELVRRRRRARHPRRRHGRPLRAAARDRARRVVAALRDLDVHLDVHLMVERPERTQIAAFAQAGADTITVHAEATPHVDYALSAIRDAGCRAGLAVTPVDAARRLRRGRRSTSRSCMSVNPGWGGQAFIPASLGQDRAACASCWAPTCRSRSTAASTSETAAPGRGRGRDAARRRHRDLRRPTTRRPRSRASRRRARPRCAPERRCSGVAAASREPRRGQARRRVRRARRGRTARHILPFWLEHAPDPAGGFHGAITNGLDVVAGAPRSSVLCARILWAFSAVTRRYGEPGPPRARRPRARRAARPPVGRRARRRPLARRRRRDAGDRPPVRLRAGVRDLRARRASPRDRRRAEPRPRPHARPPRSRRASPTRRPAPSRDVRGRGWSVLPDARLDGRRLPAATGLNTLVHVVEAYAGLQRAAPDPAVRARLQDLVRHLAFDATDPRDGPSRRRLRGGLVARRSPRHARARHRGRLAASRLRPRRRRSDARRERADRGAAARRDDAARRPRTGGARARRGRSVAVVGPGRGARRVHRRVHGDAGPRVRGGGAADLGRDRAAFRRSPERGVVQAARRRDCARTPRCRRPVRGRAPTTACAPAWRSWTGSRA